MTALPAGQTASDPQPVTVDLSAPCPDDIVAAVGILWLTVAQLRADVDRLSAEPAREP
jgi:hypothetical protein